MSTPPARRNVVFVVAKAPAPGQTKTRLCPPLSAEQASHLAGAFLRDAIAVAAQAGADVRLICRSDAERAALAAHAGAGVAVDVQQGTGLGAALETAFVYGLGGGYAAAGVLGADTPTLAPATLAAAFHHLAEGADVVLGPSRDGGYYFLGARRVYPALFQNMAWSTNSVARETLRRCHALGLTSRVLPMWDDVDDAQGLSHLASSLHLAPASVAPHTRAALHSLLVDLPVPEHPAGAGRLPGAIAPDGAPEREG